MMIRTGLVAAEVGVMGLQTLKRDGKSNIARSDYVVHLEVEELRSEAKFHDDAGELASGQSAIRLALVACDNHLACSEDERGGLGISDAHDDGGEALGIVLGITGVQRDGLQVKHAVHIDRTKNVLQRGNDSAASNSMEGFTVQVHFVCAILRLHYNWLGISRGDFGSGLVDNRAGHSGSRSLLTL